MSISTVLVFMDGTDSCHTLLKTSFAIGQSLDCHVDVLHVRADPKDMVPLLGEGMSVAMIEDMMDVAERENTERVDKARSLFKDAVSEFNAAISDQPSGQGFSVNLIEDTGREDDAVAMHGRLVDVIVAPRPTMSSDVSINLALNAALFETGRPVLLIPPSFEGEVGGHAAISWNGSVQSARAVKGAMTVLQRSKSVTVFVIENERTSGEGVPELATYLGWHGILCETYTIAGPLASVGPRLLDEVKGVNADLLVMGAYTHSRMRQLILGGVTRHILESAEIPVLLAH